MAYNAVVMMANSQSLRNRCVAAAADQSIAQPETWVAQRIWAIVATAGWDAKWQYAVDNLTINMQPDLGLRDDVLSDSDIQSAITAVNAVP